MNLVMLHRYSYNEPDRLIKRSVTSVVGIGDGIEMGTFVMDRRTHYCIRSEEGTVWYEVQVGFPLLKKYEEWREE